jgi:hypothetical protein
MLLAGCSVPVASFPPAINIVTPSSTGTPNSVVAFGNFEFVSVQSSGEIFTYNIAGETQVLAGPPYATPCADPSGMVIATIGAANVMAVACYDTGSLLTLAVNPNGSLTPLGSVSGLPSPYPGIVLDGTNVLVPLFGNNSATNGAIAKVSIASPVSPVIEGIATLASHSSGEFANAAYLAVSNGYIYATGGSESDPQDSSSTIQVVNEATMTLVGSPLTVAHSPQQIALAGNVAYVTFFDATQLESIDISNPASLQPLQIVPLSPPSQLCHAEPVAVRNNLAYIGCYAENTILGFDVTNPTQMNQILSIPDVASPQRLTFTGNSLLITDSAAGGSLYLINLLEL